MKWTNVIRYSAALAAAGLAAWLVPLALRSLYAWTERPTPAWTEVLQIVLVPLAVFLIFVWIGRVQLHLPILHAAAVWTAGTLFSLVSVLAFGAPWSTWPAQAILMATLALFGVAVGIWSRPSPAASRAV